MNLPEEATRPIAECKTLLQVAVDAGDFSIEVITAGEMVITVGEMMITVGEMLITVCEMVITVGEMVITVCEMVITVGEMVITVGEMMISSDWPQVPTNGGGGSVQSKAPTGGLREVDRRHEVSPVQVLGRTHEKR